MVINSQPLPTYHSTGNVVFSGVNTYTGDTTISNGVLWITNSGSLGSGSYPGNITNYASFNYNSSAAQTLSGVISGTGALKYLGTGTLTLNNAETYTGNTSISGGTVALGASASLATPTLSLAGGGTLDVSSQPAYVFAATTTSLVASGDAPANIVGQNGGTVSLGSVPIALNYGGASPALTIPQGTLVLNGNQFTINSTSGSPLAPGTYIVIQQTSGSIADESGTYPAPTGTATGWPSTIASISVVGGNVVLKVIPLPTPGVLFLQTTENKPVSLPAAKLAAMGKSGSGGAPSITAVGSPSAKGGTVVLAGGLITYTPPDDYLGADSFTYTLFDGLGSAQGAEPVTIILTAPPAQNNLSIVASNGEVFLEFLGIPGVNYVVQSAPSPGGPWTDLAGSSQSAGPRALSLTPTPTHSRLSSIERASDLEPDHYRL